MRLKKKLCNNAGEPQFFDKNWKLKIQKKNCGKLEYDIFYFKKKKKKKNQHISEESIQMEKEFRNSKARIILEISFLSFFRISNFSKF